MAIEIACPSLPSDVLWGEINHSLSRISALLKEKGFRLLDASAWSDEKERVIFLLELQEGKLPEAEFHLGPTAIFPGDEERFLEKHLKNPRTIAGPFISGDRWCVVRRRGDTDAREVLEESLPGMKLSPDIAMEMRRGFSLVSAGELIKRSWEMPELMPKIFMFLRKRPLWLE